MKRTLSALFLAFVFFAPQVHAGMIATDAAVQGAERNRLNTLLERPEVAQQLEKMGISAADARDRVAAMTDAEVASVAGKIDSAIAAGAMSNTDLIIVLLIVLLILIVL
ncbi:MAG TPA: PA2779 family protein [Burkholderiales bacterium]|nr:PA2779 family protein [Burkholderiales bacterium]